MNGAQSPDPHARRQRRRHLLHESRYVRDAFRRRARHRARDARCARVVRRRRHWRGRRLRTHGRPSRVHLVAPRARASATGSRTCTTRARRTTPVVSIVGDHATYHKQYDAQLESDIETVARNVSSFVRWSAKPDEVAADAADAIAAAYGPPGKVATLILPADVSWSDVTAAPSSLPLAERRGRGPSATTRSTVSRRRCGRGRRRRSLSAGGRVDVASSNRFEPSPRPPAPSCCARRSRRASSAARASPASIASPISPSSPRCSSTGSRTSCSSTPSRR